MQYAKCLARVAHNLFFDCGNRHFGREKSDVGKDGMRLDGAAPARVTRASQTA